MGEGRNIVAELEAEADWRRTEAETLRAEIERLKAALRVLASDEFYTYAPIGDVVTIATVRKYAKDALEAKDVQET